MFDKEFYPTPKGLIVRLLSPYKVKGYYSIQGEILEPSAGKGDIIDFINDSCNRNNVNISAIEKNIELQQFLHSKKIDVVDTDFLTYDENVYYDYIIMNPPFSNGSEHLMKALEIGNGTHIACILNAETIKNPYSINRKRLIELLNEKNAEIRFVKDAFSGFDSERKTNVEVALINVYVEKKGDDFNFDFENEVEEKVDFDFDFVNDAIARQDMIGNLTLRFKEVQKAYKEKLISDAKFNHTLDQFTKGENFYEKGKVWTLEDRDNPKVKYSHLGKSLKRMMWLKVINELDLKKYMSSSVLNNFDAFIRQQSNMAFNKDNVASFFQMIMNNRGNILEQSIVDVFEELTKHGYLKGNRMYVEQWKTNDRYKVNRRFISPAKIEYGGYLPAQHLKEYGSSFSLGYGDGRSKIDDLDKIMCYLSGKSLDEISTIRDVLNDKFKDLGTIRTGDKFDSKCESTFFEIKFYKKGTIHCHFKNENLWKEFNYRACHQKNWLPNDEYNDWQKEKTKQNYANKKKLIDRSSY